VRKQIVAGFMALSSPAPPTGVEVSQVEKEAQKQEQDFDRFSEDVKAPAKEMTPKEFIARTEMYGNAASSTSNAASVSALTKCRSISTSFIETTLDQFTTCPAIACRAIPRI
jgi:hypothetical protein